MPHRPRLDVRYTGREDLVTIRNDDLRTTVHYYELQRYLDQLRGILPAPCPACQGTGEIVLPEDDPREIITCPRCNGTRIQTIDELSLPLNPGACSDSGESER